MKFERLIGGCTCGGDVWLGATVGKCEHCEQYYNVVRGSEVKLYPFSYPRRRALTFS
jgi:hypothetical protein